MTNDDFINDCYELEGTMKSVSFENLQVYQLAERLSVSVWKAVSGWERLARDTVGVQLIRSSDSIGANIAEGSGRGTFLDNKRFVRIARGSLYETRHWLRQAFHRGLLSDKQIADFKQLVDELNPRLNAYLHSIGTKSSTNDQ